ncbi:hypothetical protein TWF718_010753 [Orbilia javanica]|uniref:Uncharacterized protein n=1 Tax=Orbilia javanica TaxID=47235 RepID=A0AAN8RAD3_9PEZI
MMGEEKRWLRGWNREVSDDDDGDDDDDDGGGGGGVDGRTVGERWMVDGGGEGGDGDDEEFPVLAGGDFTLIGFGTVELYYKYHTQHISGAFGTAAGYYSQVPIIATTGAYTTEQ